MENPSFDFGDIPVNLRQELFTLIRTRGLEGARSITITGLPARTDETLTCHNGHEWVPATGC